METKLSRDGLVFASGALKVLLVIFAVFNAIHKSAALPPLIIVIALIMVVLDGALGSKKFVVIDSAFAVYYLILIW